MRRHEGRGPVTPGAAQKAKMRFCSLAEGEIANALAYSCACAVALKDNSASFKCRRGRQQQRHWFVIEKIVPENKGKGNQLNHWNWTLGSGSQHLCHN